MMLGSVNKIEKPSLININENSKLFAAFKELKSNSLVLPDIMNAGQGGSIQLWMLQHRVLVI